MEQTKNTKHQRKKKKKRAHKHTAISKIIFIEGTEGNE
jgi:hypothetical protein